jgi:hypothetical protein
MNPNCAILSGLPISAPIVKDPPTETINSGCITGGEVRIEITNTNGKCIGKVTSMKGVQVFEGTEAEVRAKIDAIK